MTYLKIYTEFAKDLEPLTDTEVGRLFRAMLLYAETGKEADLRGNERFLWCSAKRNIDNQEEAYKKRCEVNRKNVTNRYESLRIDTNGYESYKVKEKVKVKDKDKKEISPKGDIKKEPFSQSSKGFDAKASDKISFAAIRQAFIAVCPSLPKPNDVKCWTDSRKAAIKNKNLSLEEMSAVFARVEKSDFLTGRNGVWNGCSFDWIFKPSNWQKICEGNYDNKDLKKEGGTTTYDLDEFEALMEERSAQ